MERKVVICMCCGLSHEKVEIKLIPKGRDRIVATYKCPVNHSMAYLTDNHLKKEKE